MTLNKPIGFTKAIDVEKVYECLECHDSKRFYSEIDVDDWIETECPYCVEKEDLDHQYEQERDNAL